MIAAEHIATGLAGYYGNLVDWQIELLSSQEYFLGNKLDGEVPARMITPFVDESISQVGDVNVPSYGLSCGGYDIRLNREDLKVFTNLESLVVDPRNVDPRAYTRPVVHEFHGAAYVIMPPHSVLLGHTYETFDMPEDVKAGATGKSTYARVGVTTIVTPLEHEWAGQLVVEMVNHSPLPTRVWLDGGVAQLGFSKTAIPRMSYAKRKGKYMGQQGTQDAKC